MRQRLSERQVGEAVSEIIEILDGVPVLDALALLLAAMAEAVEQAPDQDAVWLGILKAIEEKRRKPHARAPLPR